jgi:hypothetical protein
MVETLMTKTARQTTERINHGETSGPSGLDHGETSGPSGLDHGEHRQRGQHRADFV